MTVVVFIESQEGVIKKASLEAISYGRSIADNQGYNLIGVGFSIKDFQVLNSYGLDKLYNIDTQGDYYFNVERYSSNISSIVVSIMSSASFLLREGPSSGLVIGPLSSDSLGATATLILQLELSPEKIGLGRQLSSTTIATWLLPSSS